ncbi:transcriptional regulator [Amycolatopsis antarctica]|uniref:Transcriptional regulator n=1 Tax=Amycolatopsis antarctica TaxID=1854586 RepID=A0A263D2A7_9PSEU|nr:transcriptional regulator [Amycolatopsis antarctica]
MVPRRCTLAVGASKGSPSSYCAAPVSIGNTSPVPPIQSTSVRPRQVSAELRRLREGAGMTGADAARILGMSASKISRIETGKRGLQVEDVAALLGLYRVPERRRDEILDLVRKSTERGWWQSAGRSDVPTRWRTLTDLEFGANRIRSFEPFLVPGLLQSADYARAVMAGLDPLLTSAEVTEAVSLRVARQRWLRRPGNRLIAVLDEAVLHRMIGDFETMRGQLLKLIKLRGTQCRRADRAVANRPVRRGARAVVSVGLRGRAERRRDRGAGSGHIPGGKRGSGEDPVCFLRCAGAFIVRRTIAGPDARNQSG